MPLSFDVSNNPFAVLSAVAAPAILTNACSVLALGTSNRIARVVDRTRIVATQRKALAPDSRDHVSLTSQLYHLRIRANFLLKALRLFYTALAMFATTALTAIIGSLVVAYDSIIAFHLASAIGLIVGSAGVCAIVNGCALMARETRLAIFTLTNEYEGIISSSSPEVPLS